MCRVTLKVLFALFMQTKAVFRTGNTLLSSRPQPFLAQTIPVHHSPSAVKRVTVVASTAPEGPSSSAKPTKLFQQQLNVLYDSKCGLCNTEINFLRKKDKQGQLLFTDIEDPNYDENDPKNGLVSYEDAMEVIHAVAPDGSLVKGYDVFPAMYKAVGLSWVWPSRDAPVIGPIIDKISPFWFKYRTVMTRGKTLESLFQERKDCESCASKVRATPAGERPAAAAGPPSLIAKSHSKTSSDFIVLSTVALIGLLAGTGVALIAVCIRYTTLKPSQEPFLVS